MKTASFTIELTDKNRTDFATLSGDFNPLHMDSAHAAKTDFGKCVLHGAFSAGLFSRLAGMHLPGKNCLLHGMRLRFVAPITTPMKVLVEGRVIRDDGQMGEVEVSIREDIGGRLLVEGAYQFGRHEQKLAPPESIKSIDRGSQKNKSKILITGASGGLGQALCSALGERAMAVSRTTVPDLTIIDQESFDAPLAGIVHCGWPQPNTDGLLDLPNADQQVEYHLASPLKQCLALARLLREQGEPGAMLLLVGSSYSLPGRHAWRMPLYSLAKGLIPNLVKMLALELAASKHLTAGITLDVVRGGMNRGIGQVALQGHADRSIWGELPEMADIASQIKWVLENRNQLLSGSMLDFTGGTLP